MDNISIEILEDGKPVPPGGLLIPFPRKPDGTPDFGKGYASVAEIVATAQAKGCSHVFVEQAPDA
jgi:hypothetical protein